ncbi:addiction module protein [Desulfonatronum parangueonense]
MTSISTIFNEALSLKPSEKVQLIELLISALDESDKDTAQLWSKEAESRVDAYDQGKICAVSLQKVLQKYRYLFSKSAKKIWIPAFAGMTV